MSVDATRGAAGGWLWLAGYGVASFLSFPQLIAGHVLDLGLVLAWVGPACLLLGLGDASPGRAGLRAFLATWLAYSAIHHWIYVTTVVHGPMPPPLGVLAPFGVALFTASIGAVFGSGWSWLRRAGLANPFTAALLWTLCDHLRSFLFGGFPWALLGYAQHDNRILLPAVSVGGVYVLSFAVVLGGAAIAGLIESRRTRAPVRRVDRLALVALALLHAVVWIAGALSSPSKSVDSIRVAAIQANIPLGEKWSPDGMNRALDAHLALSREAVARGAELIVWPETAVPGPIELDSRAYSALEAFARESGSVLVIGSVGVDVDYQRGEIDGWYDSAFWLDREGFRPDRYDKTKLVPFGEYMPFRGLLGLFLDPLARGVAPVDVTPGAAPRAIDLPRAGGDRVLRAGVPICYELLFPDVVRRFVADGAGVLLAITNDGWYGRTGAPYQFLAMTALRAAETGVWIVRAANTGVSAIIDASGRVREQTDLFEPGFALADVPLPPPDDVRTFYARHGDVFAHACWAGGFLITASATIRLRRCRRKSLGEDARSHAEGHETGDASDSRGDQDHG